MTGLVNVGNTCFMNAILQGLVYLPELNNILDAYVPDPNNILLNEYNDLRKLMVQGHISIHPKRFVTVIHYISNQKKMNFMGQQDVSEFLLFMVNTFHASLAHSVTISFSPTDNKVDIICQDMLTKMYTKDYSDLIPLFYGVYVSQVGDTITPEPFFILDLPIPKKERITLQDCVDEYCKPEMVDWYNEKDKVYVPSEKKLTIWRYPPLLFIMLKRFTAKKNVDMIHVPLTIILGDMYELIWICNHQGGLMGGHYTCSVKMNKWMHFNDDNIMEIPEERLISPNTYCLLFRRIKTE